MSTSQKNAFVRTKGKSSFLGLASLFGCVCLWGCGDGAQRNNRELGPDGGSAVCQDDDGEAGCPEAGADDADAWAAGDADSDSDSDTSG